MCGLFGQVSNDRLSDESQLLIGLTKIAHRGPDGQGVWSDSNAWLGHQRLAIIDLSSAGRQPMVDSRNETILVFNGEIYNYLELKRDLQAKGYIFKTDTDTEVLLAGYLVWGEDFFTRANGMWALAIWQPKLKQLLLCRDRFGVKPLYYSMHGNCLTFGSEPASILSVFPKTGEVNPSMIADFLVTNQFHNGNQSFYRQISACPPGTIIRYDLESKKLSSVQYWNYPAVGSKAQSDLMSDTSFADLFEDAVRLRLRSDVPVGLTLSGGLDSSGILAATAALGRSDLVSYTAVYADAERDERTWAKLAASLVGSDVRQVESRLENWSDQLDQVITHLGSPGASPAVLPMWEIMKVAREDKVPVLLEGQGADELLGGYVQHLAQDALHNLSQGKFVSALKRIKANSAAVGAVPALGWLIKLISPQLGAMLTGDSFHDRIRPEWREGVSTFELMNQPKGHQFMSIYDYLIEDHRARILPSLLHYGDSVSMAHGIEVRLPFLDYRLVEEVFSRPMRLFEGGDTKLPIRSYLRANGFQVIAERRDKKGYPTPIIEWLNLFATEELSDLLNTPTAPIWTWVSKPRVRSLIARTKLQQANAANHLFKILTLNRWLTWLSG
jgi:asparagine synthase (glutamine-hydrolysing)